MWISVHKGAKIPKGTIGPGPSAAVDSRFGFLSEDGVSGTPAPRGSSMYSSLGSGEADLPAGGRSLQRPGGGQAGEAWLTLWPGGWPVNPKGPLRPLQGPMTTPHCSLTAALEV